jgi:hypothetical protein
MFYEVYASSAVRPFSNEELIELLEKSRAKNHELNVTGMLLYKDGNFMQVLEGEESVVLALMAVIARDPRHRGLLRLTRGYTDDRQFPTWSMGFRNLDSPEVRSLEGFTEFLNTDLTGAEFTADPGRAQRLLLTFKQSM